MPRVSDSDASQQSLIHRDERGFTVIPQAYTCRAVLSDDPNAPGVITNLNLADKVQMNHYMRSIGTSDESGATLIGKTFHITWFVVTRATVKSAETGEMMTLPRVTWIAPDGLSAAFSSWTIVRYMDAILATRGIGPYDPPIAVKIAMDMLDKVRRTYTVEFVAD